uniref:Transient receptor potential cation channel, subfamily V, member 1 n=1 Tax=Myripristis murdjan TaxID=586833 RepID=A0A667ZN38_9TELE
MDRGQRPGTSDFSLETDDRTEDERPQAESVKKDLLVSALGMSGSDSPKTPMDTDYSEEMEPTTPKIKFNLNFDKKIRNVEEPKEVRDSKRFDIKRLFEAATSGDVMQLDGLHQYLHQSMKKLTNSEYQTHGKNVLMKALLNLRDGKNNTVEFLLEISERMGDIKEFVNAAYTNSYYKGKPHLRSCGHFLTMNTMTHYFIPLPLSLAACTNQPEVVDFLMENEYESADAQQTDSQGNTVLHALVVVADNTKENTEFLTSMYDHILTTTARLHPKQRLEEIENNKGLTPLKLAAKTGKIGIFEHILHREFQETHTKHLSRKFTEWVYGPVHSSLYDLASLDSFEDNSVLEILVYGCDIPNRHEMLQIEPLGRLLEEKWTRFAGRIFFLNFLVYLVYLVVFTLVAYHKGREPPFRIEHTVKGYLYVSGQLLVVLASCYFFVRGIKDLKKRRPKLQMLLIDGYCEILFFLQAVLFLVSVVLYFCKRQEYLAFVVVCLALSWVNLLYFSRGYRHMGIYSVMIQKVPTSRLVCIICLPICFPSVPVTAVVTLLIEPPEKNITTPPGQSRLFASTGEDCQKPSFRNISYTTLELFKFTIGIGDLEFTEEYQYKEVFYVLLIGYIVLTYILLFNMLIALMSRTVEKITSESTSIWRLQRAITILDLERRLPHCLKRRLRCGVEKDLSKTAGQDRRWCFRVEEVNWNKWNINLGIINEDPGSSDHLRLHTSHSSPRRERSWRGFFRDVSRRHLEPRYRQHTQQSTEMRPLATSPV